MHIDTGANMIISYVPIDDSCAFDYGFMKITMNQIWKRSDFREKHEGWDLKAMEVDETVLGLSPQEARKTPYIAPMGIYVFKIDILLNLLKSRYPTTNHNDSEIIHAFTKYYNA